MVNRISFPRRDFLGSALALGGMIVAPTLYAAMRRNTPSQVLGPFYPVEKPLDQDADLTVVAGKGGHAVGQIIHLRGRVLNSLGKPVPNARVEIWQANSYGRYTHPSDRNPAPLDPNFEGFAVQITDAMGRYRFKTIKPGAYPVNSTWTRPPHIHFDVSGQVGRIVTQMYFESEALNGADKFLNSTKRKQELIAAYQPPSGDMESDSLVAVWDITIPEA
jgi:protocatechuate 3,4-dioxygenase, beta subunit